MRALDHFPLPAAEYDPQQFMREFLLMDTGLGAVECEIESAQRSGDAIRMAAAISEGKQMITHMLQYVAHAYYASNGRIKLSPIFKSYDLNFPYRPPELWGIILGKKAPRHEDEEPESQIPDTIAKAITAIVQKT